jgi:hypothetical protein
LCRVAVGFGRRDERQFADRPIHQDVDCGIAVESERRKRGDYLLTAVEETCDDRRNEEGMRRTTGDRTEKARGVGLAGEFRAVAGGAAGPGLP